MSEHLPECLTPMDANRGFWLCICKELRACEERVISTAVTRLWDYLQHDVADGWMPRRKAEGIIATCKGDKP